MPTVSQFRLWRLRPQLLLTMHLMVCFTLSAQSKRPRTGASDVDLQAFQTANDELRANHVERAVADLQKIVASSPRFADAYLNLGLGLSELSRNQEAAAALGRAILLKPSLRGAHLFLAIAEYRQSRLESAAEAVREENRLSPADAQAWMWCGIIDLARGRLDASVEDLSRAFALDPKNVDILYHRGRAALSLSRRSYEELFKVDPHSWHIHQILAEAAVEQGNDVDAVEQYALAIKTGPPQSGLFEAMGSSLWRLGKLSEAESSYQSALNIDPNDTLAGYKLGCLKIERGDAKRGRALLEQVLISDPSLRMTTYYLGRAAATLGDDETAITLFKQVVAANVDPDTTKQAYFQLSRLYRRLHRDSDSLAAQAQYRMLERQKRDAEEEQLAMRQRRAERDTSIPTPPGEALEVQP